MAYKKDLCTIFSEQDFKLQLKSTKNSSTSSTSLPTFPTVHTGLIPSPNNIPLYIHKKSKHPLQIIENIPKSINEQVSEISCDQDSFDKASPLYQKDLNDSRYKHHLALSPPTSSEPSNSNRENCHSDIIWYNPPFYKNVATKVAWIFLKILDKESPKGYVLHKYLQLQHSEYQLQLHVQPETKH